MLCPVSVFATYVSGGETCDTDVLNTDTGPVNLRAEFEPETIDLSWYDGNTRLTVPNASNTCIYDTAISLPANPTKPGYKFKGWKVINVFSTLDTTINGLHRYGKGESAGNDACIYDGNPTVCDSFFDDLNRQQWKTLFGYGTVYGDARCSDTVNSTDDIAQNTISTNEGLYCWCKVTGYKPSDSDVVYSSNSPLPWVFRVVAQQLNYCKNACASSCSNGILNDSYFRQALFGQSDS